MRRRAAGVGNAANLPLAYDEVVHLIAQDLGRTPRWVERHFRADEALRYLRMSEYHPHPTRRMVDLLTAMFTRSKRRV